MDFLQNRWVRALGRCCVEKQIFSMWDAIIYIYFSCDIEHYCNSWKHTLHFEQNYKFEENLIHHIIKKNESTLWGTFVEPSRKRETIVEKCRSGAFRNIQNYQNRSNRKKVMSFQSWAKFWYILKMLISKFVKI